MGSWQNIVLTEFAEVLDSFRVPVSEEVRDKNPGDTPYYGANGLQGYISGWLFDEPLILIAEDGGYFDEYSTRPVAYKIEGKSWVNNHAHILRPKEGFDFNFVFYSLQHKNIMPFIKGGTRAKLNQKELREIEIYVPELRWQQQKIARILQTIDRAIEQTEALIDKYQQIKAGLMHDLFTRGIGPDGQLRPPREQAQHRYQQTPIGWIPKEWCYELLDNLAVRGSGHTPSKSHPEYWNGGIKWLSLADSPNLDQLYISETAFEISDKGIQNSSAVLHSPGVVVLSRDAGIGKSAITTIPMAVSQHFMCWKGGPSMDNHFLYYWLQNNRKVFENIAMGSTILTIGLSYFRRLRIACPKDILEQTAIAERLKSMDMNLFALQSDLKKKQKQKSGLMHDLLTGKVPVAPDSEPAHG